MPAPNYEELLRQLAALTEPPKAEPMMSTGAPASTETPAPVAPVQAPAAIKKASVPQPPPMLEEDEILPEEQDFPLIQPQSNPMESQAQKDILNSVESLKKAQSQRDADLDRAELMRAGALIGYGQTGIRNEALEGSADRLAKRSENRVGDFASQVEMLRKDPNSDASKGYVALLKQMMPNLQLPEGMSAYDVEKILPSLKNAGMDPYKLAMLDIYKARLDQGQQRIGQGWANFGRLTKNQEYKEKENFQKSVDKVIERYRGTETWKSGERAMAEIPTLRSLLVDAKEDGGQSLAMLGPRIAKAIAGEVGVLTETDVTRYIQNPALVPGVVDKMTKLLGGKLSPSSYENISRLLDIAERTAKGKIQKAIDTDSILMARTQGIPLEDAKFFLDETFNNANNYGRGTREYSIQNENSGTAPSNTKAPAPTNGEVERRTEEGKTAIFDAKTKQFLRWK